ncbi:hypothetical protein B0H14DRAFT_756781 [Mycena olivaceomarginata]|nr:hypothetical protein B0H14DRAFT_756781 [Mycena olivaceomarginata]
MRILNLFTHHHPRPLSSLRPSLAPLCPFPPRQWHDTYPSALRHIADRVACRGRRLCCHHWPRQSIIRHRRNRRPKRTPSPPTFSLLSSLGPLPVLFHPRGRLCRHRHLRPHHLQPRARLLVRRKRNPMQRTPHLGIYTWLSMLSTWVARRPNSVSGGRPSSRRSRPRLFSRRMTSILKN